MASNHAIHTMHIYDIGGSHSAVTITCQLLLVAYIIYFVVEETRKMIAGIRMYFCQFLNWVALTKTFAVIGFMKETQLFATTANAEEILFSLSVGSFNYSSSHKGKREWIACKGA